MEQSTNPVAQRSDAASRARDCRDITRTMRGGQRAMWDAGTKYLPLFRGETVTSQSYVDRLKRSTYYPMVNEAVGFAVGQVFAKDVELGEDVAPAMVDWCEDIDLRGHNLHVFAATIFEDYWWNGCGLWLVDAPPRPVDAEGKPVAASRADAASEGRRPFWVRYDVDDVLGWRYEYVAGRRRLSLIRLHEAAMVEDGEFGERCEKKIRAMRSGGVDAKGKPLAGFLGMASFAEWTWKKGDDGKEDWFRTQDWTPLVGQNDIPVVVLGDLEDCSPLQDLAYLNLRHWQKHSDLDNIEHVANVPVPVWAGPPGEMDDEGNEKPIQWAVDRLMRLPAGSEWGYWEHGGACIGELKKSLERLETEMGRKAMRSILEQRPGNVTATSDAITAGKTFSTLQRSALELKDAIEQGLIYTALYAGLPAEAGGSVSVNRKFMALPREAQMLTFVQWMVDRGALSLEAAFTIAQRSWEIIPDDLKFEDEREKAQLEKQSDAPPPAAPPAVPGAPGMTRAERVRAAVAAAEGRGQMPPQPGEGMTTEAAA